MEDLVGVDEHNYSQENPKGGVSHLSYFLWQPNLPPVSVNHMPGGNWVDLTEMGLVDCGPE